MIGALFIIAYAAGAWMIPVSYTHLQQINNIVLELEKASANLGSSITSEDRNSTPLSQQKEM